ncbi:hypothetical protein CICLE_v10027692mg [Citrus x clementina]|uniref:Spectrin beta chain n=2 Tax=Citrus TaxID=2706 RepID=A0ACB8IS59_CITSI|nr:uncharacterized protein LOC18034344 isoform X2 [Citrus x clementina]ESR37491.1 hypothetical protein CICLE_v10027692mg [Citrus x clementina]KAH9699780.1 Spectrin beta chain [Citrus sinensis]
MLGSGNTFGRGSGTSPADVPPLRQCLPLEPITLGNQKYTRSGELRRVLGVPLGSTPEEHSFGVTHKKPPPVASEELKHFKESVQDTSKMARDRVKQLRDSISKLEKYKDALSSKKRQRSDVSPIERSGGGANVAKIGSQIRRNPQDVMTQRLEERTKSVGLNKRARTSAADVRADGRPAAMPRQPIVTEKDGDMLPPVSGANVRIEEKIRRLPVGGEGWDKKMKRKRSVATVGNRVINGDRDVKRVMQPKLNADSKLRSCDAQSFRSKSSPGVGGINKLDGSFELASSDAGTLLRNELESPSPRDRTTLLEQRVVKGNNKLNVQEDNPGSGSNTMLKGKASRAPRTGSVMVLDSSSKVHPSSGTFQDWEQQPTNGNKGPMLGMTNNQKRPISAASSSHAMAQWVGQRPHKISRTRRTNLVSPVANSEAQVLSQGYSTPDLVARTSSFGANGSLIASTLDNNSPKIKREFENVSSPFGLSESEESGAGETKMKEKGTDSADGVAHKIGSFTLPTRKNKILTNEVGDGVRRQGRSCSSSALTRTSIHLKKEKLDNIPPTMPVQSLRPASEKNKSKSGRPPSKKKLKDRKASIRVGQVLNNVSSDFTGESDDDHEELLAAANSARNASSLAYSGPFWKKMKSIFASLSSEDMSYLKQQLSFAEELEVSLSQMFGDEYNLMGVLVHKELPGRFDGQERHPNQEKANPDALNGRFDMGKSEKASPLYQRVLSALIEEDDIDEIYNHCEGKNLSLHYASDDSHCGSCNQMDIEPKDRDRMESEVESEADFQSQKSCLLDRFSCDKSAASNTFRNPSTSSSLHSNGQWLGDDDFSHSDFGLVSEICSNDLAQHQTKETNVPNFSSSDCQYQLMCLDDKLLLELQSIGLYPETLPGLAEGEEVINQDVMELKEGLHEQIGKKKNKLRKLDKAIQKGRYAERRNIEQCAMDQLAEMAYRKRLACRGSHSSKSAVRKASIQVALDFIKRTLGRCQKFEEMGSSCLNEPALQDILFSEPPCSNDAKSADCVGSGTASNTCNEASNNQTETRGSGAVSSTYKRYDIQSDNLDRGSSDAFQAGVRSSEHALPKHGIFPNKVKKEVLIDDVVGSASSRITSTLNNTNFSGVRGKRSERESKNTFRSMSISACGSSLDSFKSDRKTKAKSKPKNNLGNTNMLHGTNTAAGGSHPLASNPCNKKDREVGSSLPGNIHPEPRKEADELENLELNELDIGDTWFNGLQDHDSMGLEIPMDDLSDLNMLL